MFAAISNLKVLVAVATLGTGIGLTSQTAKADHFHGNFGISLNFAAPVRVCQPAPVYTPVYTPAVVAAPVATYTPVTTYTPVYAPVVVREPVYVVRPAPVIITGGWHHHGHGRHW
jgi:hypothetical protein